MVTEHGAHDVVSGAPRRAAASLSLLRFGFVSPVHTCRDKTGTAPFIRRAVHLVTHGAKFNPCARKIVSSPPNFVLGASNLSLGASIFGFTYPIAVHVHHISSHSLSPFLTLLGSPSTPPPPSPGPLYRPNTVAAYVKLLHKISTRSMPPVGIVLHSPFPEPLTAQPLSVNCQALPGPATVWSFAQQPPSVRLPPPFGKPPTVHDLFIESQ